MTSIEEAVEAVMQLERDVKDLRGYAARWKRYAKRERVSAQAQLAELRAKYDKDLSDKEIVHQLDLGELRDQLRVALDALDGTERELKATAAAHQLDLADERQSHSATQDALAEAMRQNATMRQWHEDNPSVPLDQFDEALTERNAAQAELERRTAWSNEMLARVTAERDAAQALSYDRVASDQLRAELATTREQCEYNHRQHVSAADALRTLTEAWALRELERHDGIDPDALWLRSLPALVAALIRAGAGKPVGECDACEQRSPLVNRPWPDEPYKGTPWTVCCPGWGCSAEKGKSDAPDL